MLVEKLLLKSHQVSLGHVTIGMIEGVGTFGPFFWTDGAFDVLTDAAVELLADGATLILSY